MGEGRREAVEPTMGRRERERDLSKCGSGTSVGGLMVVRYRCAFAVVALDTNQKLGFFVRPREELLCVALQESIHEEENVNH